MNTGTFAVLGMECWTPNSTKFGQRESLAFSIMNRFTFCFLAALIFSHTTLFSLSLYLCNCLYLFHASLPPSLFFHSSQMSLKFNFLYCCNKVINLFGEPVVNCRQINICCTRYSTSSNRWLPFSKVHRGRDQQ